MSVQGGFFDIDERLAELSKKGDFLERLSTMLDFELFRPELEKAVPRSDGAKGGRPAFDLVLMFKMLIIQTYYNLSDEMTEFMVKDRLTFMRFVGLGLGDRVPDANTLWIFREALTKANALESLFQSFDDLIREAGYLAMSGQIMDATIVAAPRQRMTKEEKAIVKAGKVPEAWQDKPHKLSQKDRDARWHVRHGEDPGKQRQEEEKYHPDQAGTQSNPSPSKTSQSTSGSAFTIPSFGYKNHICIDKRLGLIRKWVVTDAAAFEGHYLTCLLDKENTGSGVWADTAYRTHDNEDYLDEKGKVSKIHFKKPKGKRMSPQHTAANTARSKVRACVEHVFAFQKHTVNVFIRSIGIARAKTKLGLLNLCYNFKRLLYLESRAVCT
ncbi:MAG: IS5 family transposase [Alphaproteobacteria bacterium]|nr:IS5 family transposase [Alphaproteobacteria bacterium]OJV46300.1 MAG: IS5 family transposase [Alphaproteobacteria bacterium 43-37]